MDKDPLYIIIKSPSGGAWATARETGEYWRSLGYDVRVVSFLNDEITGTSLPYQAMVFDFLRGRKWSKPFVILMSFFMMVKWFLMTKPKQFMTVGLPISVPIFLIDAALFWRKTTKAILADTHISAHLNYKLKRNNSMTFRLMSRVTHNRFVYRYIMKRVHQVLCLSQAMADDLIENYGLDKNKAHIIPPFINTDFFNHDLPATKPNETALFVGRLSGEKNLSDMIKAFAIVIKKRPNAVLNIVGDGEDRAQLERFSKTLNIENAVHFLGRQSNVHDYHAKANCQLLTSHYEGFPLALVEACANGLPMVSFDGPSGPRDAIIDGMNGYVVPQYNCEALAEAIIKAFDKNWDRQVIRDSADKFKTENIQRQAKAFIQDLDKTHRQLS